MVSNTSGTSENGITTIVTIPIQEIEISERMEKKQID
jgi:hypothetical protein